jgi:Mrp family chromosome partitioning ATPase
MEQTIRLTPVTPAPETSSTFTMESGRADMPQQPLLRRTKSVTIMKRQDAPVDPLVISPLFYNAFNTNLLLQNAGTQGYTVGIAGMKQNSGKTVVAANLALSVALSTQRKTVLVDMHLARPQLHKAFGVSRAPGILDAFDEQAIALWETHVPDLYLLTAGMRKAPGGGADPRVVSRNGKRTVSQTALRLDDIAAFRDVLVSLREQFEFIVLDLPCMRESTFPAAYGAHVDGYVVVVQKDVTSKEELDACLRQMKEGQLLGFVLNKGGKRQRKGWFR